MTIASWLVLVEAGRSTAAQAELQRLPEIDVRGSAGGRLVVLSESESALETIETALRLVAGVRDVALTAAFEVTAGEEEYA